MNTKTSPILVTGIHRSGTSWVGKMLATAPELVTLYEPFNYDYYNPHRCNLKFPYRYTYITHENEKQYYEPLKRAIQLHFNIWGNQKTFSFQEWKNILKEKRNYSYLRSQGHVTLLKDPFALYSAPWLAKQFDMQVVVMIRHPAAFAGSIKRFGWHAPFSDLLAQPLLIRDYLHPFIDKIRLYRTADIIKQAALLWKIIYTTVYQYKQQYPHWHFLYHEDISRFPVERFESLYKALNLTFSLEVVKVIEDHSNSQNPSSAPEKTSALNFKLNSRVNIWNWKQRLTINEIRQVRQETSGIWELFYTDNDW